VDANQAASPDCSHLRRILQINPLFANATLSATRDVRGACLREKRPKIEAAAVCGDAGTAERAPG